ncbi:MAG: hypothetical protein K2O99_09655 [Lachnospiraceae bacterium]|nr:hypothetical protein [Lachnospiraceae bacterium]
MAEGFEFRLEGLEELERDLEKAVRKAPAQAEKTLVDLAKKFKKSAKKRAQTELKPHDRKSGQEKKAISARWGHKLVGDSLGAAALVWNSAPHFHLIENGHQLVRNGRAIGFVEGKHIMEKTRNEYKDIVPEQFEKMVEDILKECDLD